MLRSGLAIRGNERHAYMFDGCTRGKTDWPNLRVVRVGPFTVRTRRIRRDIKPSHAMSEDKADLRCLGCPKMEKDGTSSQSSGALWLST